MEDKISLLITRAANLGDLAGKNSAISERIGKALPSFLDGLEKRDLSTSYDSGGRLKCFWHPKLIEELADLSDENRLLSLIRECVVTRFLAANDGSDSGTPYFGPSELTPSATWEGEAIRLETILSDKDSPVAAQARSLLKYPNTCGTLLGRLAAQTGVGIEKGALSPATRIQRYKITLGSMCLRS
jgi:hypothetical protein